ncbi:MAG: transporter substrate-binding domain-containing protein [Desulforhopalus sp.]
MIRHSGLIFLVSLLFSMPCSAADSLSILTEEYPPFNFTQEGKLTGFTTQVVQEITRRLDINDNIEVVPWARGYEHLSTEANVVLFSTARTPERESLFHWVGPIYSLRLGFYARKADAQKLSSLETAKQLDAIATYRADVGEQILESLGFANLDSSNSPQSCVRKLMAGRVDLWFFDNIGAPKVAREAGIDPNEIEEVYTYKQNSSYIAFSKQTPLATVRQWQKTLDEIKADGTFHWLAQKWLPPDSIAVSERPLQTDANFSLLLYTEDSPPSSYKENNQYTGLSVEIVQEILRRIGRSDTISMVPWARGYELAQSDSNTALFSTTRFPERESLFKWVGPLYRQQWGLYGWKGSGVKVADLEAARQVTRIGTYFKDAKMQYLQALGFNNLVPTNQNINNVKHLEQEDIDLWVSSDFNMPYLAKEADVSPDQLELIYPLRTVDNYIVFSKKTSPHVIRLWQMVLDEMKADGIYQEICHRYNYKP